MKTNQLPPLPTPKFTETVRGVPCITVTEHEHLMRAYALQARAQVQEEPVTLQHMAVAENGALRWMTGRKVQNCELYAMPDFGRAPTLYATPQAAHATQAEVTDDRLISKDRFYGDDHVQDIAHALAQECEQAELDPNDLVTVNRAKLVAIAARVLEKARAILALRPEPVPMTEGTARQFVEWMKAQPDDRVPTTIDGALAEFEAHHRFTAKEGTNGEIN